MVRQETLGRNRLNNNVQVLGYMSGQIVELDQVIGIIQASAAEERVRELRLFANEPV